MGLGDSEHLVFLCSSKLEKKKRYLLQQIICIAMLQTIHGALPYILPEDLS